MKPEHVKALVTKRMQEAAECLDDGRYLLSAGRGARTVVNRAYYAAFYSVLALLQTVGKTPRKHKGALTLFDTEFVRTGLLQKDLSDTLHRLFDARQEDDYSMVDPVPLQEAVGFISDAERFVQAVRDYLVGGGYLSKTESV